METLEQIKEKLLKYPSLSYSETKNSITIHTPNKESGFDITLYIDTNDYPTYTVAFGNWHGHFDTAEKAIEFIDFGLSDHCRLREIFRGEIAYKWIIESLQDGKWVIAQETGAIFFPFWKRKVEKVYQNSVI